VLPEEGSTLLRRVKLLWTRVFSVPTRVKALDEGASTNDEGKWSDEGTCSHEGIF
jgi:hypothetical protein